MSKDDSYGGAIAWVIGTTTTSLAVWIWTESWRDGLLTGLVSISIICGMAFIGSLLPDRSK